MRRCRFRKLRECPVLAEKGALSPSETAVQVNEAVAVQPRCSYCMCRASCIRKVSAICRKMSVPLNRRSQFSALFNKLKLPCPQDAQSLPDWRDHSSVIMRRRLAPLAGGLDLNCLEA